MSTGERSSSSMLVNGDQIGRYKLLERIGRGGEAVVWSAWDHVRQRVVALKVLDKSGSEEATNPLQLSNSFEQQIHLIASLDHPNVLPLYEFGETSRFYFFAMHYGCTGSLANRLNQGPLELSTAIGFGAQIADALQYLHEHKIIHRDLKPSNILMDSQSCIYLSDFGLSKQLGQETASLHTGRGTGPYAPYEQFARLEVSPQSDIFSFGILLYEMLTGRLPWDGADNLALRQAKNFDELPVLDTVEASLCGPLTEVLRQWTAFKPEHRPLSARDAFDMLNLTLLETSILATQGQALIVPVPVVLRQNEDERLRQDARNLLEGYLPAASSESQAFPARLTHLALIDSALRTLQPPVMPHDDALRAWMLQGAFTYDYHLDVWWRIAGTPLIRWKASLTTLQFCDDAAAANVLAHLAQETDAPPEEIEVPEGMFARLVAWAAHGRTWATREAALGLLDRLAEPVSAWRDVAISATHDQTLASLALQDSTLASQAARIIGKLHSASAVEAIAQVGAAAQGSQTVNSVLAAIAQSAGGLPHSLPARQRLATALHQWWNRLRLERRGVAPIQGLIGVAVGLLVAVIMGLGVFYPSHASLQDILFQPYPTSNVITLVEINDASLEQYGRWVNWPRSLHAQLIGRLQQAGARAVVLDYLFAEPDPQDAILAAAMQQAGIVIQPILGQGDAYLDTPGTARYTDQVAPLPALQASSAMIGHTNVLHDPDGLVRRMPLVISVGEQRYPSIALAAIQIYLGGSQPNPWQAIPTGQLYFAGRHVPTKEYGDMLIHFAGPPAQPGERTYRTVTFQSVLDGSVQPEWLKDKIVLVGITATAEPDRYLTPTSRGRPMYGMEILANTIETIWSGKFIYLPGPIARVAILVILGILAGLVGTGPWRSLLWAASLCLGYFLFAAAIFDATGLLLDLLYPFFTIGLTYVAANAYRYSTVTRHYRAVQEALESRVANKTNRATVEAMYRGQISLTQKMQEVTVLVIEVRRLGEAAVVLEPAQVARLLEQIQETFSQAVLNVEGTIISGVGMQFVGVFNAPLPQADHQLRAVKAAQAIQQQADAYLSGTLSANAGALVSLCGGIFTGRALVGYTRFGQRHQFSVVGEPVQIASQLANLAASNQILIAGTAYTALEQQILVEPYGPLTINEQKTTVMTYTVLGSQTADAEKPDLI